MFPSLKKILNKISKLTHNHKQKCGENGGEKKKSFLKKKNKKLKKTTIKIFDRFWGREGWMLLYKVTAVDG